MKGDQLPVRGKDAETRGRAVRPLDVVEYCAAALAAIPLGAAAAVAGSWLSDAPAGDTLLIPYWLGALLVLTALTSVLRRGGASRGLRLVLLGCALAVATLALVWFQELRVQQLLGAAT